MKKNDNKLNVFLANLAVMNIKVHNLHWNVVGHNFPIIHKKTEKIYKMLHKQFDEVAELMKMQNKMPLGSMAEYLEISTIEEIESRDYYGEEVISELSQGCETIMELAKEIRDEADKEDNFYVVNLMEDYLACYAKHAWMFRAMQEEELIDVEELDEEDVEVE